MSLAQKLMTAAGKGSRAMMLSESNLDLKSVVAKTKVPLVNLMLSGDLNGGLIPGITQLVGDSRSFKCLDADTPLVLYMTEEAHARYQAMERLLCKGNGDVRTAANP